MTSQIFSENQYRPSTGGILASDLYSVKGSISLQRPLGTRKEIVRFIEIQVVQAVQADCGPFVRCDILGWYYNSPFCFDRLSHAGCSGRAPVPPVLPTERIFTMGKKVDARSYQLHNEIVSAVWAHRKAYDAINAIKKQYNEWGKAPAETMQTTIEALDAERVEQLETVERLFNTLTEEAVESNLENYTE